METTLRGPLGQIERLINLRVNQKVSAAFQQCMRLELAANKKARDVAADLAIRIRGFAEKAGLNVPKDWPEIIIGQASDYRGGSPAVPLTHWLVKKEASAHAAAKQKHEAEAAKIRAAGARLVALLTIHGRTPEIAAEIETFCNGD